MAAEYAAPRMSLHVLLCHQLPPQHPPLVHLLFDGTIWSGEVGMSDGVGNAGKGNLIWIDLEMTGLDTGRDQIIEIATIVTDSDLNEIAEGPVIAIRQPAAIMDAMDDWNTRHHGASGLTERVLASNVNAAEAERATLDFLAAHVPPAASPMCGNSICQDRRFLARQMPELEAYFHYRNLDVTTLKILAQMWAPGIAGGYTKESSHRALSDIRDSIAELQYYRGTLLGDEARQSS